MHGEDSNFSKYRASKKEHFKNSVLIDLWFFGSHVYG